MHLRTHWANPPPPACVGWVLSGWPQLFHLSFGTTPLLSDLTVHNPKNAGTAFCTFPYPEPRMDLCVPASSGDQRRFPSFCLMSTNYFVLLFDGNLSENACRLNFLEQLSC